MISRFNFNISFISNFLNIFKLFFFANSKNTDKNLNNHLKNIFCDSNFFFFNYGRTAFYEILLYIKSKSKKKKIIVNSLTLFEVINVIIYAGFEPIFADTKKNSFSTNISLNQSGINLDEVAAVVITHLNGANIDIINIKDKLNDYNKINSKIFLIEDCAVSLGAKIDKKNVGIFGDFSFLSFNIMKNITCYTGGVLIDNKKVLSNDIISSYKNPSNLNILKKIFFLMTIQFLNSKIIFPLFFLFVKLSHKYSFKSFLSIYRADFIITLKNEFPQKFRYFMHPFQKKILIDQFKFIKTNQALRSSKAKIYYEALKDNNHLQFPQNEFTDKNIFLDFPIVCASNEIKNNLFNHFLNKQIDVKNYFYRSCSSNPVYNLFKLTCPNSDEIAQNIIMLPLNSQITDDYQKQIINEVNYFFS